LVLEEEMIRLTNKNIIDGLKMTLILRECPQISVCLWEEIDEELEGLLEEINTGCSIQMVFKNLGRKEEYRGECPIFKLRREIQEISPAFLKTWRDFTQRSSRFPMQDSFLWLSLEGITTIYSANKNRVPFISEGLIKDVIREAKRNPKVFYPDLGKELIELHPRWFKEFSNRARAYRIAGYAWGHVLLILKIFLEGMKPVEPANEELLNQIDAYLRSQRKKAR